MTEPREPIVWLIQEPTSVAADLSSAHRYGKVEVILSSADQPALAPAPSLMKIRAAFKRYRPGDFICHAMAEPMSLLLVGLVIAEQGLDRQPIHWLRWDRERDINGVRKVGGGFYTPTIIDMTGGAANRRAAQEQEPEMPL